MEFESPDVERDFPGLYASESGRRSDDSEFSDDSQKISKKDLLIGKRKDKKDSKKDRGYATLEGESSPEEDTDVKSPSKSKKSKTFKFTTKKEKREKSREKDVKEKDNDKVKDKKKSDEKEKEKKKEKVKLKLKDKKKSKQDDSIEIEDMPVFGVPLSVATERSKCHDGVDLPLVVRDCIDHVQQTGLTAENVYKVSAIKSRVQQVKRLYNQRDVVSLVDYDLPIATSLLKQFLRELPEPIFTTELLENFEEAGSVQDVSVRGQRLKALVDQLPSCNRTLLTWLVKHFDNIASHEKQNKMNAQCIAVTLSPVLQSSQRLISALLCHATDIFPNITLLKYVPPVRSADCLSLPDRVESIEKELRKQESLLEMLHSEMNRGLVSKNREEQLWEVQRIITQLKRRLRSLEKVSGSSQKQSCDETDSSLKTDAEELNLRLQAAAVLPPPAQAQFTHNSSAQVQAQSSHSQSGFSPEPSPLSGNHQSTTEPIVWNDSVSKIPPPKNDVKHEDKVHKAEVNSMQFPKVPSPVQESRRPSATSSSMKSVEQTWRTEPTSLPANINHFKPSESLEVEEINKPSILLVEKKQLAILETEELTNVIINLRALCQLESKEINRIRNKIIELGGNPDTYASYLSDESEEEGVSLPASFERNGIIEKRKDLRRESRRLKHQRDILLRSICAECEACISLRVQIKLLQMNKNTSQS